MINACRQVWRLFIRYIYFVVMDVKVLWPIFNIAHSICTTKPIISIDRSDTWNWRQIHFLCSLTNENSWQEIAVLKKCKRMQGNLKIMLLDVHFLRISICISTYLFFQFAFDGFIICVCLGVCVCLS